LDTATYEDVSRFGWCTCHQYTPKDTKGILIPSTPTNHRISSRIIGLQLVSALDHEKPQYFVSLFEGTKY
jgi:hypothetical protein